MKSLTDAHIHIDITQEKPVMEFLSAMRSSSIQRAVLIINTIDEAEALIREKELIEKSRNITLVAGMNFHWSNPREIYDKINNIGKCVSIKIHPLLYNCIAEDTDSIVDTIKLFNEKEIKNVVIDTLFNDEYIDNHIGIELGIRIAREFPSLSVILAHSGSTRLLECMAFTRNIRNIYYDLSFVSTYFNNTSLRYDMINYLKYTSDRMMFGSDYPSFSIQKALESLYDLCQEAQLSEEQIDNVFDNTGRIVYNFEEE